MNRGLAYFIQGNTEAAIADATQAIHHPAVAPAAYSVIGSSRFKRGEIDLAIASYTEAVRLSPNDPLLFDNRGLAYEAKGDYDRAISDFTAMLRINPRSTEGLSHRGSSYLRKGEVDLAMRDFDEAFRLRPGSISVYVNRGFAHADKGEIGQARADFKAALDRTPSSEFDTQLVNLARARLAELDAKPNPVVSAAKPSEVSAAIPKAAASPAETGPRVALVIGNGAYANVAELSNPPNDARDMADALRDLGFKVIEGYDLDSTAMRGKIAEFGAAIPGAAVALLFYAGHGVQVAGKNYLVPVDAKLERPSSLGVEAIEVGTILSDMEAEKRINLVFLDACRDNPLARSLARGFGATRSAAIGQGLAQLNAGIGTLIAFATSPDAIALDGSGRNSPFTAALLKHIRTPGVEVRSMLTRVRADVIKATNDKQVPWDHSSLTGEFYFKPGG